MRRHNGEKPLECQSCLKPFTDPASLSKHLREKHAGVKTYACEVCNLVLPDVATYTKHKMTHDEDVAMCDTVTQDAVVESNSRLTTEIEVETEAVATEVPTQVIEAPEQVVERKESLCICIPFWSAVGMNCFVLLQTWVNTRMTADMFRS